MGRSITLAELRGRALRAADMQRQSAQGYAQAAEVADLINESLAELHDKLVISFEDYFVKSLPLTVPPRSAPDIVLPTDFYKFRSLVSGISPDVSTVKPFEEVDRAFMLADPDQDGYQLNGNVLTLVTSLDTTALLRYVYQPTYLVADTDALDIAVVAGWDAFIVSDVAATLLAKAGRDPAYYLARRDKVLARIDDMALRRDVARPHQVRDVYGWTDQEDAT